MSVAFCVMSHGSSRQPLRLIRRIQADDPEALVLHHHDPRYGGFPLMDVDSSRIHTVPGRPLYWGGPELVELEIEMLRGAFQLGCSYAVLLSGQDYPLRHLGRLEAELHSYDVWASAEPATDHSGGCTWPEGARRYQNQWCRLTTGSTPRWLRAIDRAARTAGILTTSRASADNQPRFSTFSQRGQLWWGHRSPGPGLPLYWGSQWMSLSRPAMQSLFNAPREVAAYFRRVPIADEAFVHTVLFNDRRLSFASDNRRYIKWNQDSSHGSPEVLTSTDLPQLRTSPAHFARKFDEQVDASVLDTLDLWARTGHEPIPPLRPENPAAGARV